MGVELMNKILASLKLLLILLLGMAANSYAAPRAKSLEGFNWYSEKQVMQKEKEIKKPAAESTKTEQKAKELPEYEKNIRDLQDRHEKAHRQALDNPTNENLLTELYLEKEMMNKSRLYSERRVAVAMLDSKFTNMKEHSNVLHRSIQEQVDSQDMLKKLSKLSKDWGLILQVQDGCAHCHGFAPIVLEFANNYGFQLLAASKDGDDFEQIKGVKDRGEMVMFNPNKVAPILYLVKSDGKEVIPISRGIHSEDEIIIQIKRIDKHLRRLF